MSTALPPLRAATRPILLTCGIVVGLVILTCGLLYSFVYRSCNPYREVTVMITGIPEGSRYVCMLADTPEGVVAMQAYMRYCGCTSTQHPEAYWRHSSFINNTNRIHKDAYRWIQSERIGVLRLNPDGKWLVSWFRPPKNRVQGQSIIWGQGVWTFSLNDADEAREVSDNELRAMGFNRTLDELNVQKERDKKKEEVQKEMKR